MTPKWAMDAIFYHIYPLGLCDAPPHNDLQSAMVPRLNRLHEWLDHIQELGANALYLGPVFEATAHGYDTVDYFQVDRRLGSNETLKTLIQNMKQRGFRVIFDGVFNHVGRDFWAFRDVMAYGQASQYCDWFSGLDFNRMSPYGDPFAYDGWAGHYDLVKLNLANAAVQTHLFEAVGFWIDYFEIDGLRLDAADHIHPDFFRALRAFSHKHRADFWLMGEVVHGDYRKWANPAMLDATTNYECYKGLYSSHVDRNYFEIAYSLNRQFGAEGIYRDLFLYNFADNHDVNRVASSLTNLAHLYTLYGLLFTMPGIPSIYYGSEWGIIGERTAHSDQMLRPALDLSSTHFPHPDLVTAIKRFAAIRHKTPALRYGRYQQIHIAHEQFAFLRASDEQSILVILNAASTQSNVPLQGLNAHHLTDLLNQGETFDVSNDHISIPVHHHWLRIMQVT
ncbi:MAG: alpha-amylase family glycosyl hydrolase [Anaerolineae bacterium]